MSRLLSPSDDSAAFYTQPVRKPGLKWKVYAPGPGLDSSKREGDPLGGLVPDSDVLTRVPPHIREIQAAFTHSYFPGKLLRQAEEPNESAGSQKSAGQSGVGGCCLIPGLFRSGNGNFTMFLRSKGYSQDVLELSVIFAASLKQTAVWEARWDDGITAVSGRVSGLPVHTDDMQVIAFTFIVMTVRRVDVYSGELLSMAGKMTMKSAVTKLLSLPCRADPASLSLPRSLGYCCFIESKSVILAKLPRAVTSVDETCQSVTLVCQGAHVQVTAVAHPTQVSVGYCCDTKRLYRLPMVSVFRGGDAPIPVQKLFDVSSGDCVDIVHHAERTVGIQCCGAPHATSFIVLVTTHRICVFHDWSGFEEPLVSWTNCANSGLCDIACTPGSVDDEVSILIATMTPDNDEIVAVFTASVVVVKGDFGERWSVTVSANNRWPTHVIVTHSMLPEWAKLQGCVFYDRNEGGVVLIVTWSTGDVLCVDPLSNALPVTAHTAAASNELVTPAPRVSEDAEIITTIASRLASRSSDTPSTLSDLVRLASGGPLAFTTSATPRVPPSIIPRHPTAYIDAGTFHGSLSHRKIVYNTSQPVAVRRRLFSAPSFTTQALITSRDLSVPLVAAEHLLKLGVFAVSEYEIDGFLTALCGVPPPRTSVVAMPPVVAVVEDLFAISDEILDWLALPMTLYDVSKRVCRRLNMAVQPRIVLDALCAACEGGLLWWFIATPALSCAPEMACDCHGLDLRGGLHILPRCEAAACILPHRVVLCTPRGFQSLVPAQPVAVEDTAARKVVGRHFQHHLANRIRYHLQLDVGGFATPSKDGDTQDTVPVSQSQPLSTAQSLFDDLLTLSQQTTVTPRPASRVTPQSPAQRPRVVTDGDSDIDATESDTDSDEALAPHHDADVDTVVEFDDDVPEVDDGDDVGKDVVVDELAHLTEDAKRFVRSKSHRFSRRRRWNDIDNCEGILSTDFVESLLLEW